MDRKKYASPAAYVIIVYVYKGSVLSGYLRFSRFCSSFVEQTAESSFNKLSTTESQSVSLSACLFRRRTQPFSISVGQPASPSFSLYIT